MDGQMYDARRMVIRLKGWEGFGTTSIRVEADEVQFPTAIALIARGEVGVCVVIYMYV